MKAKVSFLEDLGQAETSVFEAINTMNTMKAKDVFSQLPAEIVSRYLIGLDGDNCIAVNLPAYVNIEGDITLSINEIAVEIHNEKISVNLWRNVRMMHVTVF